MQRTSIVRGERTVAAFEALKGALVLIAGFGLLSLVHRDLQATAEQLVRHLHLNPARHYPQVFIEAAARINDAGLRLMAALAILYAVVRFIEAYGLWTMKGWAEWFAIISGSVYLPVELYEIFQHATWTRAVVFLVNAFIVVYLVSVRIMRRTGRVEAGPIRPAR